VSRLRGIFKYLHEAKIRGKQPASAKVLNNWIRTIEDAPGSGAKATRLSWLVASTIVTAALQRAIDEDGSPRFVLKGGSYINYLLNGEGRSTSDVDGMIRGDLDDFMEALDVALSLPWAPFTLTRTPVETFSVPDKLTEPRRFYVMLNLKGKVWRKIQVEVSPPEGLVAAEPTAIESLDLHNLGIETPDQLVGIALRFQIAQKIHACTGPHDPPDYINTRVRDVVDLLLLRNLAAVDPDSTPLAIQEACQHVFEVRAAEAATLGRLVRTWPPKVAELPGWSADYGKAAEEAGLNLDLTDAIAEVNGWLDQIAGAGPNRAAAAPPPRRRRRRDEDEDDEQDHEKREDTSVPEALPAKCRFGRQPGSGRHSYLTVSSTTGPC
jgi:hypothetical protein